MDDLISRQAMLDGIDKLIKIHFDRTVVLYKARKVAEDLPSVQPETNCSEIPNNSDTVSRHEAIDFAGSMNMCDEISNEAYKKLTSYLDELPSVQPEREKGEWVYNSPVTMKCNRCGLVIKDWDWHRFKICPNCGADMRGEENETD